LSGVGESCVLCGAVMRASFRATVLGRHEAQYWSCPACGHFRTGKPHWLPEAYSRAIAGADTGLVMRNVGIARQLACVLHDFFDSAGTFLDTAGGTGLLTRLMRDVGFDFRWEDPYCENVLAYGFEATAEFTGYEAVTACEALEHMEEPLAFVRSCLGRSRTRTLIFTTELFEGPEPPRDWWYFAFPTGQHISFFSARTLEQLAARLGVRFLSHAGLHALTAQDIAPRAWRKVLDQAGKRHAKIVRQLQSRTMADHEVMLRRAADAAKQQA
jgi:hypothetical protein